MQALLDFVNGQANDKDRASVFVKELRQRLADSKCDKLLIRLVNEKLQAFGPGSTGANLLINRYLPRQESLLYKFDQLVGNEILEHSSTAQHEEERRQTTEQLCTQYNLSATEVANAI